MGEKSTSVAKPGRVRAAAVAVVKAVKPEPSPWVAFAGSVANPTRVRVA